MQNSLKLLIAFCKPALIFFVPYVSLSSKQVIFVDTPTMEFKSIFQTLLSRIGQCWAQLLASQGHTPVLCSVVALVSILRMFN